MRRSEGPQTRRRREKLKRKQKFLFLMHSKRGKFITFRHQRVIWSIRTFYNMIGNQANKIILFLYSSLRMRHNWLVLIKIIYYFTRFRSPRVVTCSLIFAFNWKIIRSEATFFWLIIILWFILKHFVSACHILSIWRWFAYCYFLLNVTNGFIFY